MLLRALSRSAEHRASEIGTQNQCMMTWALSRYKDGLADASRFIDRAKCVVDQFIPLCLGPLIMEFEQRVLMENAVQVARELEASVCSPGTSMGFQGIAALCSAYMHEAASLAAQNATAVAAKFRCIWCSWHAWDY
eukprot:gnl/TRDRNA2_/TRDRNA2_131609_c0_seq1.p1 gnl/TRDRNA2_/TRDRNA2_131609_c0~~gnl/TRDRNA2_/TRDRNA2_131609_c0_seq1.p1  ORF type:complete len:136 (-),score=15.38 gnl/TRDRNA2_/TRDRNA2_131609_c0_seq1:34-441(-)